MQVDKCKLQSTEQMIQWFLTIMASKNSCFGDVVCGRVELYLEITELAAFDCTLLAACIRGVSSDIGSDCTLELCF